VQSVKFIQSCSDLALKQLQISYRLATEYCNPMANHKGRSSSFSPHHRPARLRPASQRLDQKKPPLHHRSQAAEAQRELRCALPASVRLVMETPSQQSHKRQFPVSRPASAPSPTAVCCHLPRQRCPHPTGSHRVPRPARSSIQTLWRIPVAHR
jgi:hypothetical protein